MSLALRATGSRHQFDIKGLVQTHYYPAIRYPAIRNPAIRYPAGNYPVSIRNPVSGKKPIRYIPSNYWSISHGFCDMDAGCFCHRSQTDTHDRIKALPARSHEAMTSKAEFYHYTS